MVLTHLSPLQSLVNTPGSCSGRGGHSKNRECLMRRGGGGEEESVMFQKPNQIKVQEEGLTH